MNWPHKTFALIFLTNMVLSWLTAFRMMILSLFIHSFSSVQYSSFFVNYYFICHLMVGKSLQFFNLFFDILIFALLFCRSGKLKLTGCGKRKNTRHVIKSGQFLATNQLQTTVLYQRDEQVLNTAKNRLQHKEHF